MDLVVDILFVNIPLAETILFKIFFVLNLSSLLILDLLPFLIFEILTLVSPL